MSSGLLITPTIASTLADAVYGIRQVADVRQGTAERLGAVTPGLEGPQPTGAVETFDSFDLSGSAVAGRSGAGMFASKTGFGMVVPGKGKHSGDIAVVCRGTAINQDWLSNFNAAVSVGPGGLPVHTGFCRVYNSMVEGIENALRGSNPSTIHVVGHSLGGAIANLFAMRFALQKRANICLYTFGAPRPGTPPFVFRMHTAIPNGNIKRVYAMSDVVPMLPIFPFYHAPMNPGGLRVDRGGQLLSINSHFMSNYKPAVFLKNWNELTSDSAQIEDKKSIDFWVGKACSALPMSTLGIWALGNAIKGILSLMGTAVGGVVTAGLTLVDSIAQMIHKGIKLGELVADAVRKLISGISHFLGRAINTAEDLTLGFLKYVLGLLFGFIATIARRAIDSIR
ncbi:MULTISPECIES: lipase family protein [Marivita]|uniref:Lipase family protein n=1 Tax=Marivita cryptomonadis TaxID=505252 RepID=A0A9Q2PEQ9_9RHOB|nr:MULTISPECIES: lipase family protein [Marivita]MCR9169842.1 lipase family protein [Paracoccaceae bacterium]MBM2323501.1 lipase family protein [Marivita cryptomonadis]MBM2333087.1 lipase family protein [Marivita cryptomonadis]MBM2342667.1 lipase family protein [Marivita cryptomonadis]MBM2347335.1 lipase family protein [Marivita cryptomonadis]